MVKKITSLLLATATLAFCATASSVELDDIKNTKEVQEINKYVQALRPSPSILEARVKQQRGKCRWCNAKFDFYTRHAFWNTKKLELPEHLHDPLQLSDRGYALVRYAVVNNQDYVLKHFKDFKKMNTAQVITSLLGQYQVSVIGFVDTPPYQPLEWGLADYALGKLTPDVKRARYMCADKMDFQLATDGLPPELKEFTEGLNKYTMSFCHPVQKEEFKVY